MIHMIEHEQIQATPLSNTRAADLLSLSLQEAATPSRTIAASAKHGTGRVRACGTGQSGEVHYLSPPVA
jgi:hypothetical protein